MVFDQNILLLYLMENFQIKLGSFNMKQNILIISFLWLIMASNHLLAAFHVSGTISKDTTWANDEVIVIDVFCFRWNWTFGFVI